MAPLRAEEVLPHAKEALPHVANVVVHFVRNYHHRWQVSSSLDRAVANSNPFKY